MAVSQQEQAIPDAPKPQVPALNTVVPGSGTTAPSTSATAPAATPAADAFQPPVGSALPSSPAPVQTPSPAAQPGDQPEPDSDFKPYFIRSTVNFVEVPFTVKDNKGKLVPGLTWRDVRIYENNVRQKMLVFTSDPFPLSVALVIDQSMSNSDMNKVNNSLGALQGAFTAYDEVAVFTYNNTPKKQTDFTAGQSARLSAVVEQSKTSGRDQMFYDAGSAMSQNIMINNGADSHTNPLVNGNHGQGGVSGQQNVPREVHPLNDAILAAAQAVVKAGKGRRRVVYVISDGKEYGSVAKSKDVIKYLQTNKIAVYATLVGDSSVTGLGFVEKLHLPLMMRDNILPVYANATGGEIVASYRQKEIENSFAEITKEVRTQYTVGYNTTAFGLGETKMRKIEVKVLRPNLQVIAKEGYYPSSSEIHVRGNLQDPATPATTPQP
ncbi:VWFA-related domain-containing protein [Granulicella rosea]|uniref:VWFA-related domain-containing protein n=2 Tax=Granulicella rosea TaxID=474952 RepID=A0A239JSK7_9BACT|nr:VWFA-related domain-containing protein [Granulicella rosea]